MTESIWIAIIGAVGVIGAAIIGLFKKSDNKKSDKSKSNAKTTVNQTVTGNHNTVIGIQRDRKEK